MPEYEIETPHGKFLVESPKELTDDDIEKYINKYNQPQSAPKSPALTTPIKPGVYYGSQDMQPKAPTQYFGSQDMVPRSQPAPTSPVEEAKIGALSSFNRGSTAVAPPPVKLTAPKVRQPETLGQPQSQGGAFSRAWSNVISPLPARASRESAAVGIEYVPDPELEAEVEDLHTKAIPRALQGAPRRNWALERLYNLGDAISKWKRMDPQTGLYPDKGESQKKLVEAFGEAAGTLPEAVKRGLGGVTDILGQVALGEKEGWFVGKDDSDTGKKIQQHLSGYVTLFVPGGPATMSASLAGSLVKDPDQAWEAIKQSYGDAWNPKADPVDRIASGIQWAATVFGLSYAGVRGKTAWDDARIHKTLIKNGFTPEEAAYVAEQAKGVTKTYNRATSGRFGQYAAQLRQAFDYKRKLATAEGIGERLQEIRFKTTPEGYQGPTIKAEGTTVTGAAPKGTPQLERYAGGTKAYEPTPTGPVGPVVPKPTSPAPREQPTSYLADDLSKLDDKALQAYRHLWDELTPPERNRLNAELKKRNITLTVEAPIEAVAESPVPVKTSPVGSQAQSGKPTADTETIRAQMEDSLMVPKLGAEGETGPVVKVKSLGEEGYVPLVETYKGRQIVKTGENYAVWDPEKESLFVVALDDSKSSGNRFINESANNVETAREYIDWLDGTREANASKKVVAPSPVVPRPPSKQDLTLRSSGDEPKPGEYTTRENIGAYAQGWKDVTDDHPGAKYMKSEGYRLIETKFRTTDSKGRPVEEPAFALVNPDRKPIYLGRKPASGPRYNHDRREGYFNHDEDLPDIEGLIEWDSEQRQNARDSRPAPIVARPPTSKPKDNRKGTTDGDTAAGENNRAPQPRDAGESTPQRGEAEPVSRTGDEREAGALPSERSEPSRDADAPSDGKRGDLGRGVRDGEADPVSTERGRPAESGRQPRNYRYPEPESIGRGSFGQKTTDLLESLKALKEVEAKGKATPAQLAAIARFPGWGWTGNHLNTQNPPDAKWLKAVRELLTDEEFAAARRSTLNSHYTAPEVILAVWKALRRLGYTGGKALEPSAGTGLFIGLEPNSNKTEWSASELDDLSGRVLKALNPAADIRQSGYEKAGFTDGAFDLVISNVPFGNYKIYDADLVAKTGEPQLNNRIHNYFFAKALEHVRPGGVVAFITTHGTLDASDAIGQTTRRYLASQADLLGAIRLPDNAFQQNAGTDVVTDIIFLRKRIPGEAPSGKPFEGITNVQTEGKANFLVNQYFVEHPEMVLGTHSAGGKMYRAGAYTVKSKPGEDLSQLLDAAIARLPKNVMGKREAADVTQMSPNGDSVAAPSRIRVGGYFEHDGQIYIKANEFNGNLASHLPKTAQAAILDYLPVRDVAVDLIDLQRTSGDADLTPLQTRLKKAYDGYVKRHGPINGKYAKYFVDDPESAAALMLEDVSTKGAQVTVKGLADIFTQRVISPVTPIEKAGSARDAMLGSMRNLGRIDMDEMSRLSGLSETQIVKDLRGMVFDDPITGEWLPADAYGSGNVRKKLEAAKRAANKDAKYKSHVEFLENRQPKDLEPHEISAKLGAPWVPPEIYGQFVQELVSANQYQIKVTYNPALSRYNVIGTVYNANNTNVWGAGGMTGVELVEHILNSKQISITYKSEGKTYPNVEATQLALSKAEEIRNKWQEWVYAEPARAERLAQVYNQEVNAFVSRTFDGSFLDFPGQSLEIDLRAHQRNAVWRTLQTMFSLFAHDVGTGKTYTIITSAMELRRTGLRKKPMIVAYNNTEGQIAASFKKLYPGARILVVDKKSIDPQNRKKLFGRIAGNDWDAIIIRHSDFKKIPVSPALMEKYMKEQIDAYENAKRDAQDDRVTVKDLEKAVANLEAKLQTLRDKIAARQDDSLYWEQLGVDHLFVDEAHEYKKLDIASTNRSLRTEGSQMARDLMMKMVHLKETQGGVTFATGTPISNSLAELHTIFRYLMYDELKAMGLENFDPWMRMFTEETTEFLQDVAGRWKPTTKISKFSNIPELQMMFRQVADVVPKEVVENITLPKLVDEEGNVTNAAIKVESVPNDAQVEYFRNLLERADAVQGRLVPPNVDNVLKISTDGRKASMDIRLIDETAIDHPDSKINQAVGKVLDIYKMPLVQEHKGTQFVFLDYGTPKETKPVPRDIKLTGHPDEESAKAAGAMLEAKNYEYEIVAGDVGYDILVDLSPSFNLYDDIKGKLMKGGIPKDQIAYVHDAKSDAEKLELWAKVNSGEVRVLMSSTKKGGVGVNVQERMFALHHMDAPWRPADYEQREGRFLRQGNIWATLGGIREYNYINVGTYDAFMWNKLTFKERFIKQVMKGDATLREAEDLSDDGKSSFAEMAAAATGDPRVSEYLSLQDKIKKMEIERAGHGRQQLSIRSEIGDLEKSKIPKVQDQLATAESMNKARIAAKPEEFEITVNKKKFTDKKDAGLALLQAIRKAVDDGTESPIASYSGFDFSVTTFTIGGNEVIGLHADMKKPEFHTDYPLNVTEQISRDDLAPVALTTIRRVEEWIEGLGDLPDKYGQNLKNFEKQLTIAKSAFGKDWKGEEGLKKAKEKFAQLEEDIGPKLREGKIGGWGQGATGDGVAGMFTDPDGAIKLNSGISAQDILDSLKSMDDLSYTISGGKGPGTFSTERKNPKRGYGILQNFRQPLSIVDGEGNTIQVGTYERLAGQLGKKASETIRDAQIAIDSLTTDWERQIDKIGDHLQGALDEINKAKGVTANSRNRKNAVPEFIEIIESPMDDPRRTRAKGELKKAITLHDKLTEYMRTYIIEARRELGIDMPDDWGITEQGYYRHLFMGDIRILVDGQFVGTARTYAEAQKRAMDEHAKNPGAEIVAEGRSMGQLSEVVRLSNKKFFKVAKNIADTVSVSMADIMEDIRGEIGLKSHKMKFFGALKHRTGAEGYSKDYMMVMRMHAAQVARTQELSKLNRALEPVIQNLKSKGLDGLAKAMETHLDTIWGTASTVEKQFGDTIRNTPILRNYVANPDFALRGLAMRLTRLQTLLKISWNARSTLVNLLQPYSTLWPYMTEDSFVALYRDLTSKATRDMLKDKGIFDGETKLEETISGKKAGKTMFRAASSLNRAMGYLYGYRQAKRKGLTEEEAHKSGLAWAEKVEFDNSVWNGAPIFRSPGVKVLGQFKGFMFKNLEHWADAMRSRNGDSRYTRAARVAKLIGQQFALGGLKSLIGIAKIVGFGYLTYKIVKHMRDLFVGLGMDKDVASTLSDALYYGAPSLIGQDLTASVTLVDAPFGNDTSEQVINFFTGPTTSMGIKVQQAAEDYFTAEDKRKTGGTSRKAKQDKALMKGAKAITPYVKMGETAVKMFRSKDGGITIEASEETIKLTPFEASMMILGFTPAKVSRFYDRQEAKVKMPNPKTLMELLGKK